MFSQSNWHTHGTVLKIGHPYGHLETGIFKISGEFNPHRPEVDISGCVMGCRPTVCFAEADSHDVLPRQDPWEDM